MLKVLRVIEHVQNTEYSHITCPCCRRISKFMGIFSPAKCKCGKPFPDIELLIGREHGKSLRALFTCDDDTYFSEELRIIREDLEKENNWNMPGEPAFSQYHRPAMSDI